jgi:uncharacterized membrane protein
MIKILENKKIIVSLIIVGLILFVLFFGWYLFLRIKLKKESFQKEETMEEILKSLTAPGKGEVSSETLKSLTAPTKEKANKVEVSEEVLKSLTAPRR